MTFGRWTYLLCTYMLSSLFSHNAYESSIPLKGFRCAHIWHIRTEEWVLFLLLFIRLHCTMCTQCLSFMDCRVIFGFGHRLWCRARMKVHYYQISYLQQSIETYRSFVRSFGWSRDQCVCFMSLDKLTRQITYSMRWTHTHLNQLIYPCLAQFAHSHSHSSNIYLLTIQVYHHESAALVFHSNQNTVN